MIKRKTRNIRTRVGNDEEEAKINISPHMSTVKPETTEKDRNKKSKKGKVVLSFGIDDEEQEETFQITKSAASRRLEKSKSKKLHVDHKLISQDPNQTTPSYTKEMLSELRASTPTTPASFQSQDTEPISGIPSASAISAAKKEREMRRKKGLSGASDYISLSEETDITIAPGKKIESRLVREEDELGEEDEVLEQFMNEKLAIGKKARKEQERLKKADIEEMIMDVVFEDEDDELLQWELEAMKAGGHIPKKSSKVNSSLKQQARIPTIVPVPTLNEVQSHLESQLVDLQELYNNHQAELIQMQREIDDLTSSNAQMEVEMQNTKKRYTYFQELKTFVENLVEFLDNKFPILEKIEKDYQEVLIEKSRLVMQRTTEDDSDDIALFNENVNIGQEQVRQQRRQQRDHRRFLRKSNISADELEEGFSTDDELSKNDEKKVAEEIDEILYHHTSLFDDVIEDFKSISLVKSKFMSWKAGFNDDYTKAYGGLSLPGVFEFYVRYEMMLWNTLTLKVNDMEWYKVISEYSVFESNKSNSSQMGTDDDFTILGKVFEKIVLPRIAHLVKALNPYSSKQTVHFIEFFERTLNHVDKKSQNFQEVITRVSEHLRNVVISLEVVPDIPISDSIARNRYFWRKYKLLRNLVMWKELIPADTLRSLSIDYLLNQNLLHILNNSSSETDSLKYQKILEVVPGDWLPSSSLERIARGAARF